MVATAEPKPGGVSENLKAASPLREKEKLLIVGELEAGDARAATIPERGDVVAKVERVVREAVAIEQLGRGVGRDRVEEILDVALEHADGAVAALDLVRLE